MKKGMETAKMQAIIVASISLSLCNSGISTLKMERYTVVLKKTMNIPLMFLPLLNAIINRNKDIVTVGRK